MTQQSQWTVGCFTPCCGRQLMMRNCILQMIAQSRQPDHYSILLNGNDEQLSEMLYYDLYSGHDWIKVQSQPGSMLTIEAYSRALEPLLDTDTDLFVKIDSDDIYRRHYLQQYIENIDRHFTEYKRPKGFCFNLVGQTWINAADPRNVSVEPWAAVGGLGLTYVEQAKGMTCGAPPTYVFDRRAAEVLMRWKGHPRYSVDVASDRTWRNLLFEAGIPITCLLTNDPIFGYVRHEANTCTLISQPR